MHTFLKIMAQKVIFSSCVSNFLKVKLLLIITLILLISGSKSIAQNQRAESIQNSFIAYQQNNLQEKIYLHTDKDLFMVSEILWFKAYLVDGFFHKPLNISKVVYVELLEKNNKAVLQAKIEMKDGFGNGSFQLPVSTLSGHYTLRAYTNWMKNYDQQFFFEKAITIINPSKPVAIEAAQNQGYEVNFFPEGGNLVHEIQSKIAFHVVDYLGKGQQAKGIIINEKKDTLTTFSTEKFGMGSFQFKPQSTQTYTTIIRLENGKTVEKELPKTFEKGFVMQIIPATQEQLKVSIKHSNDNQVNSPIYLLVHTKGVFKQILTKNMQNNEAVFLIDKNKLGDGISQITLFNEEGEAVCERLYFKYPEKQLQIDVKLDGKTYESRKKIIANINSTDQKSKPKVANLSMSVYQIDSLQTLDRSNIHNYLWLSADLKGQIEAPEYYFKDNGIRLEQDTDNLMLTHGWRRFRWETLLADKKADLGFLPEHTGHILSGKITNTKTNSVGANINSFLTVPSTQTKFYTAASNKDGDFKFDLKGFYNEGEIILQTNPAIDSNYSFKISSPYIISDTKNRLSNFSLSDYNLTAFTNHYRNTQIQNSYLGRKNKPFMPINKDTMAFYGVPDFTYLLDNYVRFTTMEEVLREYVQPVIVRKSNNKYKLHVLDKLKLAFFETDPLILLDGLPIFEMDKFLSYDPLKIRKLEVISGKYYLRNMMFDGIANFVTYKGQLPDFELDPKAVLIDYEGLQLKREFYSPKYDNPLQSTSRLPDFRQTMYWNPQIKTDTNGFGMVDFYTSDLPGKYAIVLQGITPDGVAGVKVEYFEVQKK